MRILVCGLSGSGKTTLADELAKHLGYARVNADAVRAEASDWDFSAVGRLRQAQRLADKALQWDNVVLDAIVPLRLHRAIIKADKVIWMNTKQESKYTDTDSIFEAPSNPDVTIADFDYDIQWVIEKLGLV